MLSHISPAPQALLPQQWAMHALVAWQSSPPAQASFPSQVVTHDVPPHSTPPVRQALVPMHDRSQVVALTQSIPASHESLLVHATVHAPSPQVTPASHEFLPEQVTAHMPWPHTTGPSLAQSCPAHNTLQLDDAEQSTPG